MTTYLINKKFKGKEIIKSVINKVLVDHLKDMRHVYLFVR